MGQLHHIALEGSTLAGKSTELLRMHQYLQQHGIQTGFAPEAATTLLKPIAQGGIGVPGLDVRWSPEWQQNLQEKVLQLQKMFTKWNEEIFASSSLPFIVYHDRGFLDLYAFLDEEMADEILHNAGLTKEQCFEVYDSVFYFDTLAKTDPELYTELQTKNNPGRFHSAEQALELDKKLLQVWSGHPRFIHPSAEQQATIESKGEALRIFSLKRYEDILRDYYVEPGREVFEKSQALNLMERCDSLLKLKNPNQESSQETNPFGPLR